jgi:AmmeMemoRadiSam system protein A
MLTVDDRQRLLILARRALEARVRRQAPPEPGDQVAIRSGAFVTISRDGELRGCLGHIGSSVPLPILIVQLAQEVADSDPRFDRVTLDELAGISLEISVLTPERDIASIEEIEVGRHGLIVEHGTSRGLLLPQVAVEHGWDRETFLDHTCLKAGLQPGAWKRGARVLVFEADVFGERHRSAR